MKSVAVIIYAKICNLYEERENLVTFSLNQSVHSLQHSTLDFTIYLTAKAKQMLTLLAWTIKTT